MCSLLGNFALSSPNSCYPLSLAFIDKNTYGGLEEFYAALSRSIYEECDGNGGAGAENDDDANNNNVVNGVAAPASRGPRQRRAGAAASSGAEARVERARRQNAVNGQSGQNCPLWRNLFMVLVQREGNWGRLH